MKDLLTIHRLALAVFAAACLLGSDSTAGVIRTTDGHRTGQVEFRNGKVLLDSRPVPWRSIVSVLTDEKRAFTSPNALVMRNGETWRGTILGLRQNTVRIRTAPFGAVDVDLQLVACLHFNGKLRPESKPGRLYRVGGTPVSGKLAGISATALSINSALGVFNLSRSDVSHYITADRDPAGPATGDELALLNGSVYRGTLAPAGDKITLEHPILGKAEVTRASVLYLRRHDPAWSWPADKPWEVLSADSPLGQPDPPEVVERHAAPAGETASSWIKAVRLEADTTVSCAAAADTVRKFSALVGPASPHGGTLHANAGDRLLAETRVEPGDSLREWSFEIPAGSALAIRCGFPAEPAVPCRVVVGDPLLVEKELE